MRQLTRLELIQLFPLPAGLENFLQLLPFCRFGIPQFLLFIEQSPALFFEFHLGVPGRLETLVVGV